ncbi:MAG: sensor histidine kinase [Flammeovirgaceae bacterium]
MNKTLKKLVIILCFAILLPVVMYAIYELNTLTQNEQELKEIYARQLKAVLFSVNLHSQDLVNSTVSKMENLEALEQIAHHPDDSSQLLKNLFNESSYLEAMHVINMENKQEGHYHPYNDLGITQKDWYLAAEALRLENQELLERLIKYSKGGFRKLQPLRDVTLHDMTFSTIVFVRRINEQPYVCTLFINTDEFSFQVLIPKLQVLAEQDFELFIIQNQDSISFSTIDSLIQPAFTKEMWLLPNYQLGISPKGKTLDTITRERKQFNLLSLSLLIIFILLGGYIMFRNLRKEMDLTQQKSEFVSNVSHEIRTPLALISMFGETLMLGRVKTEEKKREYYEIITKEAARLTNIVNRILNFSKIEANKKEYQLSFVDLNEIVEEVLYTYSFHIKSKGYTYRFDETEDLPQIKADREAVMESIVNLIDNAMKYSPHQKQFELKTGFQSTQQENDEIFVAVKDYGIGIPSQSMPYLFDKFYRVPQGNVHNAKGSGLGLSIVKHIMEAHGGSIQVNSVPNQGSEFKLVFKTQQNQLNHA